MRDINNISEPPKDLHICFGGGNFRGIGNNMIGICREKLNLQPHEKVLDIGCGIGRLAFPLLEYLSEEGGYDGFDTFPVGVKWCSENITPEFPNFRFQLVDIYSSTYNPYAQTKAADFVFPYEDNSFDLIMLNSVFTHMMPDDILNYIKEMDRVLSETGRIMATFFLVNNESNELMNQGKSVHDFFKYGIFYTADPKDPMDAVGYDEKFALNMFEQRKFKIQEIMYGNWCGRKGSHHQDVLLITR
ncbi:methyltransferase domain-containing protein [Maridesulfovibrio sp.]|uniref:class I SAM-dependent methyltransferase n=1 Tax=Maridesulfovibrio sp. TaxID=2795000 RepID=UPI0029C9EF22|nr:methyltransferase domain-containing protein [Maridesulfovibrio sp.]